MDIVKPYNLSLPIAYDWEPIEPIEARTNGLSGTTITDCALSFCQEVENAGYDAAVYFYRHLGYYEYELGRLSDYDFWVGAPGDTPDFYYKHSIWQYSFTGTVPGISGEVDLNLMFLNQEDSQTTQTGAVNTK